MADRLPCSLIKRNKKLEITFDQLAYECLMEYQAVIQWRDISPIHTAEYFSKAEKLLEILEVLVCGSVGGFDDGQYSNESGRFGGGKYYYQFDRFLWVWNHYTTLKDKKQYKVLVEEVSKYFLRKKG